MRTEYLVILLLGAMFNWLIADFHQLLILGLRLKESLVLSSVCSLISTFMLGIYVFGLNMDPQQRLVMALVLYITAFGISYRLPRLVTVYLDDIHSTPYALHADVVKIFPFAVCASAVALASGL